MILPYNTRDENGKDFIKEVEIKKHPVENKIFTCICGGEFGKGVPVKKIVSSNFTDWNIVSEYVCEQCADLFSLYFYSYIVDPNGIRLLNIREMAEEIQKAQTPPFKIIITVSQKKHLFFKSIYNENPERFIVNLENEQIYCDLKKIKEQFLFVGSMQALGESKERMKKGEIRSDMLMKVNRKCYKYLREQLKTRQIQIPLHLSQKINIMEEEALCNLDLILNH